jgi:hypothetical protein
MSETNLQTANTILEQIGGKALYMFGTKNKVAIDRGVQFKIGRNAGKVTHVRVTLTPADLYDVEFLKVRGTKCTTISTTEGAYADMLTDLISNATGMAASL